MIKFKNKENKIFAYDKNVVFVYDENNIQTDKLTDFIKVKIEELDLTQITELEAKSFKLFGVWNKTQQEVESKETELLQLEQIKQQQKAFNNAIQTYLDNKAQEYKWDNMQSARAGAIPIKDNDSDVVKAMKNNAETLTDWYFNVWATASQIQADVKAGNRDMPTVDEVLAELPEYQGI